ncbi:dihydroneopterin triphosphate pyrophosphatase [Anopheles sinensis]|uniref:Dihydroneopterin triphosphate pyrophosphatase n=1 Tax=Anopheles sinensis TaxID=74873 RepID=A0A084WS07_ANOSI|nr:dihydroneopterin triphosphate pyrophosphatase [Anopheles sinensis]
MIYFYLQLQSNSSANERTNLRTARGGGKVNGSETIVSLAQGKENAFSASSHVRVSPHSPIRPPLLSPRGHLLLPFVPYRSVGGRSFGARVVNYQLFIDYSLHFGSHCFRSEGQRFACGSHGPAPSVALVGESGQVQGERTKRCHGRHICDAMQFAPRYGVFQHHYQHQRDHQRYLMPSVCPLNG